MPRDWPINIAEMLAQYWYDVISAPGHPRTKGWPLIDSPVHPLLVVSSYLLFTYRLGPHLMRNRKPFHLRSLILLYNAFQVLSCVWYIYQMGDIPLRVNYFCLSLSTANSTEAFLGWIYMLLKYLDLVDTVFFVLKKKQSHITFLHLFHHSSMVLFSWAAVKYHPGGLLVIIPVLNVWVHLFMYGYYFLMAYNGRVPVYWKKKMTQLQIIQFGIGILVSLVHIVNPTCDASKTVACFITLQGGFLLSLFGHFYCQTYRKAGKVE